MPPPVLCVKGFKSMNNISIFDIFHIIIINKGNKGEGPDLWNCPSPFLNVNLPLISQLV